MSTHSLWQATVTPDHYPALSQNLSVDVVVVGGGNTGVTTAYLLKKAGLKVALMERERCGNNDTGHTSSHLTYVTDLRIAELNRKLGKDHAAAVWDAGAAAIQQIELNSRRERIACDFARVPGFVTASLVDHADEREELRSEVGLAREMGFDAHFVEQTPLFQRPGIRFANQARFHPLKYLQGLLKLIPGDGSQVFEQTAVESIEGEEELKITANGHTIQAGHVVIATDVPLQGKSGLASATLLQTKIKPYTSYVIGASVPKGTAPDVLIWDTYDPYHFYRLARGNEQDTIVFGGADHKTGQQDDPQACFHQLEALLCQYVPGAQITQRWSGQVIESVDGLPYIGETARGQFIATGFSGNGLTYGTLAAMMACDWVLGKKNPWVDLFAPSRKKLSALWNYLTENIDYPYYMLKDRLQRSEVPDPDTIPPGEGRILKVEGQRLAIYRGPEGQLTSLSAICPHMGCVVHWNDAERTWDCPCHGSRFHATGEVLAGPAETNLEQVSVVMK